MLYRSTERGLSLIETLVGASLLAIVALGIYQGYVNILQLVTYSKLHTLAMLTANEELEIIRNLPYESVGIVQGIPDGILPRYKQVTKNGTLFHLETSIRNVDDPFDGTIGGNPNDLAPADYKQVEIHVGCPSCVSFATTTITTTIAPKSLESTGSNGALFVHVFNGNGMPVSQATVRIVNNQVDPAIVIDEVTNNDGVLQLVDVPPGAFAYEITVSKSGYSTARTYPADDPDNPNPVALHATVATGALTEISFAIDELSTFNVRTTTEQCELIGNVDFVLRGSKRIGTDPDIYKYEADHSTNSSGSLILPTLEWDSYTVTLSEAGYQLAGSIPLLPLSLNPGSEQDVLFVLKDADENALLVTVLDASTGLPLSGATVAISGGASETLVTNRGFIRQTDWSTGDYTSSSGIDDGTLGQAPTGELRLLSVLGMYQSDGVLESKTFDTGSATTTYYSLSWQPQDQATSTGASSVRFQLASGNDAATSTWHYLGPDGTANTYYTLADTNVSTAHSGHRYVRYKLFLHTDDTSVSPSIFDVALTFSSDCVPYGQVLFQGLPGGTHTVEVSKSGYQTYTNDLVNTGAPWQELSVSLSP